jgi:hypothetical protein
MNYVREKPHSPHMTCIISAIRKATLLRWSPSHGDSGMGHNTPIVLSLRELQLVQALVKQCPEAVSVRWTGDFTLKHGHEFTLSPIYFQIAAGPIFDNDKAAWRPLLYVQVIRPLDLGNCSIRERSCEELTAMGINLTELVQHPNDPRHLQFAGVRRYILSKWHNEGIAEAQAFEDFISRLATDVILQDKIERCKEVTNECFQLMAHRLVDSMGPATEPKPAAAAAAARTEMECWAGQFKRDCFEYPNRGPQLSVLLDADVVRRMSRRTSCEAPTPSDPPVVVVRPRSLSDAYQAGVDVERHEDFLVPKNRARRTVSDFLGRNGRALTASLTRVATLNTTNAVLKFWAYFSNLDRADWFVERIAVLSSRYSELMQALRFEAIVDRARLVYLVQAVNRIKTLKMGSACLAMLNFAERFAQYCGVKKLWAKNDKKKQIVCQRTLGGCLVLANHDRFFETFVALDKLLLAFPVVVENIKGDRRACLDLLQSSFWAFLSDLESGFAEQTRTFRV